MKIKRVEHIAIAVQLVACLAAWPRSAPAARAAPVAVRAAAAIRICLSLVTWRPP